MIADLMPMLVQQFAGPEQAFRARPSSAGPDRCVRQLVYHALGYPRKPLAGRALLIFDDSSWHEELTLDVLRRSAYRIHSEQMALELEGALPWMDGAPRWECGVCTKLAGESISIAATSLHGHIDGLFTDPGLVDRLLEHKAINHFSFNRYWDGTLPMDYLAQVAIYMRGVQLVNPELREWCLLIKNKNTSQFFELVGEYVNETDTLTVISRTRSDGQVVAIEYAWANAVAECIQRFATVAAHAAAETLPARPFTFGTEFPCGYCPYEETCWRGYETAARSRSAVAVLPELADALARYKGLSEAIGAATKEKDKIKAEVVDIAEKHGAKTVIAGGHRAQLSVQSRTLYNTSLLAPEVIAEIAYQSTSEQLRVYSNKATE